jgi:hypothetical protein
MWDKMAELRKQTVVPEVQQKTWYGRIEGAEV